MALVVIVIRLSGVANSSGSSSWSPIGDVAGTPTELFYVYPNIYVRTSDDLLYVCDRRQKICSPTDLDTTPSDTLDEHYCDKPEIDLSDTPGKVVASLSIRECAADGYVEHHMIALDDGTIWTQSSGSNAISTIFQFICMAGGFVGLLVYLYIFWRSIRHQAQEKAKR
jgi:hypothetical protein